MLRLRPTFLNRRSFSVVSRREVDRLRSANDALAKPKLSTAGDEKPWPQSVVLGFFGAMAVVIPYTTAWFLAQHGSLRDPVVEAVGLKDDHPILHWMRRTFGTVDWELHPDNHNGLLPGKTEGQGRMNYKMEDEPTLAIRQQQIEVHKRNETSVKVKILTGNDTISTEELLDFPAHTLVNVESFGKVVALDFPDEIDGQADEQVEQGDHSPFNPQKRLQVSIYSPWHFHSVPETLASNQKKHSSNDVQFELDRLQHQIEQLETAIKNGRDVDEVKDELRDLRNEQRRLQFRRYFW